MHALLAGSLLIKHELIAAYVSLSAIRFTRAKMRTSSREFDSADTLIRLGKIMNRCILQLMSVVLESMNYLWTLFAQVTNVEYIPKTYRYILTVELLVYNQAICKIE